MDVIPNPRRDETGLNWDKKIKTNILDKDIFISTLEEIKPLDAIKNIQNSTRGKQVSSFLSGQEAGNIFVFHIPSYDYSPDGEEGYS